MIMISRFQYALFPCALNLPIEKKIFCEMVYSYIDLESKDKPEF